MGWSPRRDPVCDSLRCMRIALVIPLVLVVSACSGVFLRSGSGAETRYRHRELGYEIAYPSVVSEPGWQMERLDQADLAFRHPEGSIWALASNCRTTRAAIGLLASELARATGGTALGTATALEYRGLEGLVQRLERVEGSRRLQIKTLTLRGKRCTYDWILIAPSEARFGALEKPFDDWWMSFEPGPDESTEGSDG